MTRLVIALLVAATLVVAGILFSSEHHPPSNTKNKLPITGDASGEPHSNRLHHHD